jgi:hypothetical protein
MAVDLILIDTVIVGPGGNATGPNEYLCGYESPQFYDIDVESAPDSRIDFFTGYFTAPYNPNAQVGLTQVDDRTLKLSCESGMEISFRTGYRIVAVVES